MSNAAHVSNALKNEDHRRTLENNIQKSLHNTLQLNNLHLQETLNNNNNSISNHHNSQSAASSEKSEFQDSLAEAKVQIKSTLGVRNQGEIKKSGNNSNSNNSNQSRHIEAEPQQHLNKERVIIHPQITGSVQQIKPQFSPHLPTTGGHNAMNIGSDIVCHMNWYECWYKKY